MISYDPELNVFIGKWESGDPVPQIMWHVTDICPLGCPFCFAHKSDLSVEEGKIKYLCDFLSQINVLKIDIAGGEPLTYRHLPQIARNLRERSIFQTITTSGIGTEANKTSSVGLFL